MTPSAHAALTLARNHSVIRIASTSVRGSGGASVSAAAAATAAAAAAAGNGEEASEVQLKLQRLLHESATYDSCALLRSVRATGLQLRVPRLQPHLFRLQPHVPRL